MKLPHELQIYSTVSVKSIRGCIFHGSSATNYRQSGKFNYVFMGR